MRIGILIGIALASASCEPQTYNSLTGDPGNFAADSGISDALASVRGIFRTYCIQCHAAYAGYSDAGWIASGLVKPGSPATSSIYTRLRGVGLGVSSEDMPLSGAALSTDEREVIKAWINTL